MLRFSFQLFSLLEMQCCTLYAEARERAKGNIDSSSVCGVTMDRIRLCVSITRTSISLHKQ